MPHKPLTYGQRKGRDEADRKYDQGARKIGPLAVAKKIRSSKRWQVVSGNYLKSHPFCEDPRSIHSDCPASSKQVHHVKPAGLFPELAFSPENFLALCTTCHDRIEKEIRRDAD